MKDYSIKINGQSYNVQINELNEESKSAQVAVNGKNFDVEIEGMIVTQEKVRPKVAAVAAAPTSAPLATPRKGAAAGAVTCPLPGTIVDVMVKVGDKVNAGQTLIILEAMKMENNIDAETSGVVKEILTSVGATVMEGDALIVIE